ncbi:MYND finger [Cercophora newfieldiana]|uniref:MYND finger n=1 Tax=Cercophora newfieldiana TaxID=92897 RepID=A0AA40CS28_9PEZI|nr:MYND finger [Cercophora newfieldiana]
MLTPSTHATVRPFYAFGNTPAVCLTEALPQGVDADVLLLGCGDVRHLLYTCYAEKGLPPRKLDVTACDIEPMIIARNILLLSLIIEGPTENAVPSEQIWRVFYNLYLDDEDSTLLSEHTEKLLSLSTTPKDWNSSIYGAAIRFVDENTFHLVRAVWQGWSLAAAARRDPSYKAEFEKCRKESNEYKDKAWGKGGSSYSSAKVAAPLFPTLGVKLAEATELYWQKGTSDPRPIATNLFPNPAFASAISATRPLTFADPMLSFHLAPAKANLTKLSPLRLEKQTPEELKVFETAQLLFKEWTTAFKQAASESRALIRFTAADCYSLCQTLQHHSETRETCANWYQRESTFQVLTLSQADYEDGGKAPSKFDMIDTSNLSDYNGVLNLLVSAGPLLKDKPWSTLYTEIMARNSKVGDKNNFESLLCDRTTAISLLLGLTPIECWTNAKAASIMDEILAAAADRASRGGVKIQSRLAWKLDRYISGTDQPARRLRIEAQNLVELAYRVYLKMFEQESLGGFGGLSLQEISAKNPFPKYHRGTFVAFLKTICKSVQTNTEEVGRLLFSKLENDNTLAVGSNHLQLLCRELSSSGIFTHPGLINDIQHNLTVAPFCKWKQIPSAVAVTIVIPATRWQPIYRMARDQGAALVLEGHVKCAGVYENIFSDVQLSFGTLTTVGSKEEDDFRLTVAEDSKHWLGDSPLIASFTVNTVGLQINIPSTDVSLDLQPSLQTMTIFAMKLGGNLSLFQTRLLDEKHVYITKFRPGQTGNHVLCASNIGSDSGVGSTSPGSAVTWAIDPQSATITGHIDATSGELNKLIVGKAPIELQQVSPFTINVQFGKGKGIVVVSLTYPLPVAKDNCKSRIARTSGYYELVAPILSPPQQRSPDDFVFPTVLEQSSSLPATLNIPHLSLDTLPILALDDKKSIGFLSPLSSFMFSARELAIRQQTQSSTNSGLSSSARVNFKESLFTMLMLASGLQGGQSGLFGLATSDSKGIHILIFVSAIRLDGPAGSVVLDAAVLPLTTELIESHKLEEFLLVLRTLEIVHLTVDEAELRLWKNILPAFAERCRTWQHSDTCEYRKVGRIPLSLDTGTPLLCSCGTGHFPEGYLSLPEWDAASAFSTRVAISPTAASAFVEDVIDPNLLGMMAGGPTGGATGAVVQKERCRTCAKSEGDAGVSLKACARCMGVKYCSAECQKKDWKKHRMECKEI